MLDWIRKLLSPQSSGASASDDLASSKPATVPNEYVPRPFSDLYVEPDDSEEFDSEACIRLLKSIEAAGASNIDDLTNVVVSIESFFDGNHCKHSIAANVEPPPPYNIAQAWAEHLKTVRGTDGVSDVFIAISMIEPYEDGRVGTWPYADTIWVYSTLDREHIFELLSPLDPDEVRDASAENEGYNLSPPLAPADGVRPYWVWWD